MSRLLAEIKPLDILGPIIGLIFGIAVVWIGLAVVVRFFYLLVQPFYAVATGKPIEEDSKFAWAAVILAGGLYWQLS